MPYIADSCQYFRWDVQNKMCKVVRNLDTYLRDIRSSWNGLEIIVIHFMIISNFKTQCAKLNEEWNEDNIFFLLLILLQFYYYSNSLFLIFIFLI